MSAALVFILYVVSSGNLPDMTAMAAYQTKDACQVAAGKINDALASGEDAKTAICLNSDSLRDLASKNNVLH